MQVNILGVGLLAAGLDGWQHGREVLAGTRPYQPLSLPDPEAAILPPNERRRGSDSVRWAIQVAQEAIGQSRLDPHDVATVFATSGGEMDVLDQLCRALDTSERVISPTLFHQSVHNTAAGYWGIATKCQQSSTALSCYDDSCAAGLLEAITYASVEACPVLFVAYDLPAPEPLFGARPIRSPFAVALVMTVDSDPAAITVGARLASAEGCDVSIMADGRLEQLRLDNPAARLLPMLRAIGEQSFQTIVMNLLDDQRLVIEIAPCLV